MLFLISNVLYFGCMCAVPITAVFFLYFLDVVLSRYFARIFLDDFEMIQVALLTI